MNDLSLSVLSTGMCPDTQRDSTMLCEYPDCTRLSGEIQMGHTPPFAGIPTALPWLPIPDHNRQCARLDVSDIECN